MNEPTQQSDANAESMAKIVYILYLVGIVFGVTGIIGVVIAYINRNDGPEWLQSHYTFQIRTFWIGFLYLFIGGILAIVLIGYLVLLFWVVWLIIRCIKGIKYLDQRQAHPDPEGWMF